MGHFPKMRNVRHFSVSSPFFSPTSAHFCYFKFENEMKNEMKMIEKWQL